MSTQFTNRQWRLPNNENKDKQSNYSMDFDGSSYINAGNDSSLAISGDFTISLWVNQTTTTAFSYLLDKGGAGSSINYRGGINSSNQVYFQISGNSLTSTGTITNGTWSHIVLVKSGTSMNIYIDNTAETPATAPATAYTGTENLEIGRQTGGANYLDGKLDAISIYNYALSSSQVTTLYGSSSTGIGNPMSLSPAPVAYYPLGDQDAFNGASYLTPNSSLKDFVFDFGTFTSNDRIVINNNFDTIITGTDFTISSWINLDSIASNQLKFIFTNETLQLTITNKITTYLRGASGYFLSPFDSNTILTTGKWYNIVLVKNGSDYTYYLNGSADGTVNNSTSVVNSSETSSLIGDYYFTGTLGFDGRISNTQIFNSALPATGSNSIETLYNNGSPLTSMSGFTSLQGWWKLDASATYDGTDWTIPDDSSNSNDGTSSGMTQANLVQSDLSFTSGYSPYALDFDGANDYIDLTSDITLSGNRSISMWIKVNTGFSFAVLFGGDINVFYPYIDTNNIAIRNNDTSTAIAHNGISVGMWYNFCVTGNGTTASFYQNGSLLGTGSDKNLTLKYINTEQAGLYGLNGSISNVSIWNAALTSSQVTEIYNEGVPSNLNNHSAYSNLVSWWQLGSNSSFNTNWTVLDEKGTNNGTSANMTEDDIVDGVGSYANGLSSGMGGDEVIGDAPYSSSNSLSVNMDALDRVEDTPS